MSSCKNFNYFYMSLWGAICLQHVTSHMTMVTLTVTCKKYFYPQREAYTFLLKVDKMHMIPNIKG